MSGHGLDDRADAKNKNEVVDTVPVVSEHPEPMLLHVNQQARVPGKNGFPQPRQIAVNVLSHPRPWQPSPEAPPEPCYQITRRLSWSHAFVLDTEYT
jgi:hypothetical protein